MQELKNDILERANQIVSLCQNADTFANQTVMTLADQHERLVNIQTHLISMDTTLTDTKKDINRLKGITRRIVNTFRVKFHRKIRVQKQDSSPRRRPMPLKSMQSNSLASDPIIDEQIDQALYQIDHLISSLKDKAYTINDQLVGQADTINHIHECMEESTQHIQQQNIDMKKIGLIN